MALLVNKSKLKLCSFLVISLFLLKCIVDVIRKSKHHKEITISSFGDEEFLKDYLSGIGSGGIFHPHKYHLGDSVPVYVEKIRSDKREIDPANNGLTSIPYFDLSFTCMIEEENKSAFRPIHKSVMEIFKMEKKWESPLFDLEFGYDKDCEKLCEREVEQDKFSKIRDLIDQDYQHYWFLENDLPGSTSYTGKIKQNDELIKKKFYKKGFPLGYKEGENYYLNTHFMFLIRYKMENVRKEQASILSFEVYPKSLDSFKCSNFLSRHSKFDITRENPSNFGGGRNDVIPYSYSVYWIEEKALCWNQRWQFYFNIPVIYDLAVSRGYIELVFFLSLAIAHASVLWIVFSYRRIIEDPKKCLKIVRNCQIANRNQPFVKNLYDFFFINSWQFASLFFSSAFIFTKLWGDHNITFVRLMLLSLMMVGGTTITCFIGSTLKDSGSHHRVKTASHLTEFGVGKTAAQKQNNSFYDNIPVSASYGTSVPLFLFCFFLICEFLLYKIEAAPVIFPNLKDFHIYYLLSSVACSYFVGISHKVIYSNTHILKRTKGYFRSIRFIIDEYTEEIVDSDIVESIKSSWKLSFLKYVAFWLLSGLVKAFLIYEFFHSIFISKNTFSSIDKQTHNELLLKIIFETVTIIVINTSINAVVVLHNLENTSSGHTSNWKIVSFFMSYSSFPFIFLYSIYCPLVLEKITDFSTIFLFIIYVGVVLNICFHGTLLLFSAFTNIFLISKVYKNSREIKSF